MNIEEKYMHVIASFFCTVKSGSKDRGLITRKLVIRPPVFLISNFFTIDILSLPYYIQRFIKQKSQFDVKKKVSIKKKRVVP